MVFVVLARVLARVLLWRGETRRGAAVMASCRLGSWHRRPMTTTPYLANASSRVRYVHMLLTRARPRSRSCSLDNDVLDALVAKSRAVSCETGRETENGARDAKVEQTAKGHRRARSAMHACSMPDA